MRRRRRPETPGPAPASAAPSSTSRPGSRPGAGRGRSRDRPKRSSRARGRSPARACATMSDDTSRPTIVRCASSSASSRVNSPEPHPTSSTRAARATTGATAGLREPPPAVARVVGLERLAVRGVVARRHGGPVALLLRGQMSAHPSNCRHESCASTRHVLHRCDTRAVAHSSRFCMCTRGCSALRHSTHSLTAAVTAFFAAGIARID